MKQILSIDGPAIIVSDLHLGSPHFLGAAFTAFLETLPSDARLILNGDTIDRPGAPLPLQAEQVLARLGADAGSRPIVIRGNHDETDTLLPARGFEVVDGVRIPQAGLFVCHGDEFHNLRVHHRWFIGTFRLLHGLRVRLGAPPVHVAEYAKRWGFLYRFLQDSVRESAVEFALENGFRAIACGHVHYAEDSMAGGVRYINTGCWTEQPSFYAVVKGGEVCLRQWPDGV